MKKQEAASGAFCDVRKRASDKGGGTVSLVITLALCLLVIVVAVWAQNSVPPTAHQAAGMPEFASRLVNPTAPDASLQSPASTGERLGATTAADNGVIFGHEDPGLFGTLSDTDPELAKEGSKCAAPCKGACGPVAAVNSFVFLQNKYNLALIDTSGPGGLHEGEVKAAEALCDYMQCGKNGVDNKGFSRGKRLYIQGKGLKDKIAISYADNPTASKLAKLLQAGEDVEISLEFLTKADANHWVTLYEIKLDPKDSAQSYIKFWDPDGAKNNTAPVQGTDNNYIIKYTPPKEKTMEGKIGAEFDESPIKGTAYDNGPVNGNVDAWTINAGYVVSDTFTFAVNADVNTFTFWAWLIPGDVLQTAEISITSDAYGGTTYYDAFVNFTQSGCVVNPLGFQVCKESGSFSGPSLNAGTYFVNVLNASVPSGDPVYWDENSGIGCGGSDGQGADCPSQASVNTIGTIPSEAFTIASGETPTTAAIRSQTRAASSKSSPAAP